MATTHTTFSSPRSSASTISEAVTPGRSPLDPGGTPQAVSTSARSSGFATRRCPGRVGASPPASRPPIAFGCPVNENGPAPGRPMFPVASERLISARFLSTPEVLWLAPIVHIVRTGPFEAIIRAASTISWAASPVMSAARSADQPASEAANSSPAVRALGDELLVQAPASRISKSRDWRRATSVPAGPAGRGRRFRPFASGVGRRR